MDIAGIRKNRTFAAPQRRDASRTEKPAEANSSQKAAKTPGVTVSETLRQLMSRTGQAESHSRKSRQTLQAGEIVLAEVQEKLGRMAEITRESAGDGDPDRAALQRELEQLGAEIERMISGASVGGVPLFLGEDTGLEGGVEALLAALADDASPEQGGVQPLPGWLVQGISQPPLSPEQILTALGLDRTASGSEILAALTELPLEEGAVSAYLAALYLGSMIAGSASGEMDPERARAGIQALLEKVADGLTPDQAIALLTGGAFTGVEDFQNQFTGGTAPGLQAFLTDLLLSDSAALLPDTSPLLALLAGIEGSNLDLLMGLLTASPQSADLTPGSSAAAEAPAGDTGRAEEAAPFNPPSVSQSFEGIQVSGRDLSGVSFSASKGELTIGGTADITIQGTGQEKLSILITGSGVVTLRNAQTPAITIASPSARMFSTGENILQTLTLREGVSLTLGGNGFLRTHALRGDTSNLLRMTGGALAVVERDGRTLGSLAVPVQLDGPVSLAAQASRVSGAAGKPLTAFDLVWKTLLPGWSAITAMEWDGRQAKMALSGSQTGLVRLWLEKGDLSSQGYPARPLTIRGRDEAGRLQTRYAYLYWNQRTGRFEKTTVYPNPFTVTGGEENRDWIYEEPSRTLRILSGQVSALAGGSGTDGNESPFSGRIALADGIGAIKLALNGVVCQVASGRAFSLGQANRVTLLLGSGTDNIFESGAGFAGISLGDGTTLCIDRDAGRSGRNPDGTLTAASGDGGAGIGRDSGRSRDQSSSILICGGIVAATGHGGGAGIGAGKRGFMGSITILGGAVTATGGSGGGAGIGGALGAPAGDIDIRGGTVTAAATNHAAAIGAGIQGECGSIRITGSARILRAVGGDPGADIGACLLGGCGKVLIDEGANLGGAKLWTRPGISLRMGADTLTLPQFRLSSQFLQLNRLDVSTRAGARSAGTTIEADRRWVSQLQTAYNALYAQLDQGFGGICQQFDRADGLVRDAGAANLLLRDMRRAIPLPSSRAMHTHGRRGTGDAGKLLQ